MALQMVLLDAETLGDDADLSPLEEYGALQVWKRTQKEQVVERGRGAEVLVINKVRIGESELAQLEELKLICITATGTDNVDLDAAESRGIAVTNVAGYSTESVAQHTIGMVLAILHQLAYYDEYVKSGRYTDNGLFTHLARPFWQLHGKQWGIIGLGTIGSRVAEIASAFGTEIAYFSASGRNTDRPYPRLSLEELLGSSDVVSIHAPLTDATRGLIGSAELRQMRSSAILVNAGRGGIVDEQALASALDAGQLGGAALDVFAQEPPASENPLLSLNSPHRLLLTPHNAWTSVEARVTLIGGVAQNIGAFLAGERRNRVR
jgi:glycerate dehydrogenase